jgi:hypothetical protein
LDKPQLTHLLWVWIAHVQTTRVHLKQQIRQAERTAVDHNYCVHFAIMSYPISLDKVLEANDICDGFLAVPD